MSHPIFHEDERCYALVPTSTGEQQMPCRITGGLKRRSIEDLDGNLIGYANAYLILMEGATLETPWAEEGLRKMRPQEWKRFT